MGVNEVQSALVKAYKMVTPELPTRYPSMKFDMPQDAPWARVSNHPASNAPATMGDNGEDHYTGYFQIDIHQPKARGSKYLNDKADEFRRLFKAGARFSHNGQEVVIRRAVPSTIGSSEEYDDDVISVTVYWYARFQRA